MYLRVALDNEMTVARGHDGSDEIFYLNESNGMVLIVSLGKQKMSFKSLDKIGSGEYTALIIDYTKGYALEEIFKLHIKIPDDKIKKSTTKKK